MGFEGNYSDYASDRVLGGGGRVEPKIGRSTPSEVSFFVC